jgi:hypothetical protein
MTKRAALECHCCHFSVQLWLLSRARRVSAGRPFLQTRDGRRRCGPEGRMRARSHIPLPLAIASQLHLYCVAIAPNNRAHAFVYWQFPTRKATMQTQIAPISEQPICALAPLCAAFPFKKGNHSRHSRRSDPQSLFEEQTPIHCQVLAALGDECTAPSLIRRYK